MTDARIKQTQEAIFVALDELLAEKEFKDITVTDLAQHAGIGRQTFYRHFDSTGAVLEQRFQLNLEEQRLIAKECKASSPDWPLSVYRFAFERIAAEPHIAKLILSGEAGPSALSCFRDQITALNAIAPHDPYKGTPPKLQRFWTARQSGALVAVLLEWLEAGCAPSAATMSRFMVEGTLPK